MATASLSSFPRIHGNPGSGPDGSGLVPMVRRFGGTPDERRDCLAIRTALAGFRLAVSLEDVRSAWAAFSDDVGHDWLSLSLMEDRETIDAEAVYMACIDKLEPAA